MAVSGLILLREREMAVGKFSTMMPVTGLLYVGREDDVKGGEYGSIICVNISILLATLFNITILTITNQTILVTINADVDLVVDGASKLNALPPPTGLLKSIPSSQQPTTRELSTTETAGGRAAGE